METNAFVPHNLTLDTIQAAIELVAFKHGPDFKIPQGIYLSPTNCHELKTLPPTFVKPDFMTKSIDVLGIKVLESGAVPDDEIVLLYGPGDGIRITLVRITEPMAPGEVKQEAHNA